MTFLDRSFSTLFLKLLITQNCSSKFSISQFSYYGKLQLPVLVLGFCEFSPKNIITHIDVEIFFVENECYFLHSLATFLQLAVP